MMEVIVKKISDQELKSIELDILKAIHQYCKANGIVYYLCGGTLLGAVRHSGFIPWDDDIDIYMPRPDYERFISCYKNKVHKVLTFRSTRGYPLPFAKVCDCRTILKEKSGPDIPECGVFVDVFPLDGLSNKKETASWIHKVSRDLLYLAGLAGAKLQPAHNIKGVFKKTISYMLPQQWILRVIDTFSKRYSFSASEFVGVTFGFYGDRETHKKSVFAESIDIEFEGMTFCAPKETDQYLKTLYGNYMELPPVEKRVTHHSFEAFWKE